MTKQLFQSRESLAYVHLSEELEAEFASINPARKQWGVLIDVILCLAGGLSIPAAIWASGTSLAASREGRTFVVLLCVGGLITWLAALAHLALTTLHSIILNRYLCIRISSQTWGTPEPSVPEHYKERATVAVSPD